MGREVPCNCLGSSVEHHSAGYQSFIPRSNKDETGAALSLCPYKDPLGGSEIPGSQVEAAGIRRGSLAQSCIADSSDKVPTRARRCERQCRCQ